MPPLVKAFLGGDAPTAHSLSMTRACLCSSTLDGCSPLHWLFAFQNQTVLDDIVGLCKKMNKHCLAGTVNLPFSIPRDVHCQWPLRLHGSPLAVAISVNSLIAVKALLELGADPFSPDYYQVMAQSEDSGQPRTAFHIAARYHCSDILQYLVEQSDPDRHKSLSPLGLELSFSTSLERLAMHGSRCKEQLDRTVRIIQSFQSLKAAASDGMTALMQAIDFQDEDVVASLLQAAPELASTPFCSPKDRNTFNLPIHFAAQIASHRHAPDTLIIPELIDSYTHHLDPSGDPPRDNAWRTPLHLGVTGPSDLVAHWILQRNPGLLHVQDCRRRNPLHYCTSATTCKMLLQKGAVVDHCDNSGTTALHRACLDGAHELVEGLVAAEPNLSLRNKYGTPLHCAVISGSVDVVLRLLEAGAPVNMTDYMGNTAVHVAARLGRHQILRILMRHCADTTLKNVHGRDGKSIAVDAGSPASGGVLHLLDMHRNFSRPFSEQDGPNATCNSGKPVADFLWTERDLQVVAHTAEHEREYQVNHDTREQAAADEHQNDGVDDEYGPGNLGPKIHNSVMNVVHRTLRRYRASNALWFGAISRDFIDCLVASSLVLADGDIWRSDLASRAGEIMARLANDLALAIIEGFPRPNKNDRKGLINGRSDSKPRGRNRILADGTGSISALISSGDHLYRSMSISAADIMSSHVAQLVLAIKPKVASSGRSPQQMADMIRCELRRLSSPTLSIAGWGGHAANEIPTFLRPPSPRWEFADKYSRWEEAETARKETGGSRQQEQPQPSTTPGWRLDTDASLRRLLSQDYLYDTSHKAIRPPSPQPEVIEMIPPPNDTASQQTRPMYPVVV
jgi:ankyrin repeat protein